MSNGKQYMEAAPKVSKKHLSTFLRSWKKSYMYLNLLYGLLDSVPLLFADFGVRYVAAEVKV